MKRMLHILVCGIFLTCCFSPPVLAQKVITVEKNMQRPAQTPHTLQRLAEVLGGAHYIQVLCQGKDNQTWRNRMVELLELENPDYYLRQKLVGAFNAGYQKQRKFSMTCDNFSKQQLQTLAKQGRILSDALADPYLH